MTKRAKGKVQWNSLPKIFFILFVRNKYKWNCICFQQMYRTSHHSYSTQQLTPTSQWSRYWESPLSSSVFSVAGNVILAISLADVGGVPGARPQGSRFFRFDIQNFRNVTASGVHAPPPTGNPGSALNLIPLFIFKAICSRCEIKV